MSRVVPPLGIAALLLLDASLVAADTIPHVTITAATKDRMAAASLPLRRADDGVWRFAATETIALEADDGAVLAYVNPGVAQVSSRFGRPFAEERTGMLAGGPARSNGVLFTEDFDVQAGSNPVIIMSEAFPAQFDPPLPDALILATAEFTVTDGNGDGATLQGLVPHSTSDSFAYRVFANAADDGIGTTVAEFFQELTAPPGGTSGPVTASQQETVPVLEDISGRLRFSLTPFDLASGVITVGLVPEPSTLLLLLIACPLLCRR